MSELKHSKKPILYSFRRCPYAMRARMALYASGTQCELREIVLRDKPASMLAASPKGTVPVMVLPDGQVLEESLDIMLWALGCSDPDYWIVSDKGRDQMLDLIDKTEHEFKKHLDKYKYASRHPDIDATIERNQALLFLFKLDALLQEQKFLSGNELGLADIAIMPFVRQFRGVDPGWFDTVPFVTLHSWLKDLLESVYFKAVMKKYVVWQQGDAVVIFPDDKARPI